MLKILQKHVVLPEINTLSYLNLVLCYIPKSIITIRGALKYFIC
jgi:hypothetical protein